MMIHRRHRPIRRCLRIRFRWTKKGAGKDSEHRNFTDVDSRIQKDKDGFVQSYHGRFVVAGKARIIVAHGLSNQAPDTKYFIPMLVRTLARAR